MLNKSVMLSILMMLTASLLPSFSADQTVTALMTKIDQQALQERRISDEQAAKRHAIDSGKQMKAMINDLAPNQLVELVRLCWQKMREIPSDPKHEPYFGYYESVMRFSIRQLGEQKTNAAKEALEQVHAIVLSSACLMETWDEAKEKQGK